MICHQSDRTRTKSWMLVLSMLALFGCDQATVSSSASSRAAASELAPAAAYAPVTVTHKLGTTVVESLPKRVVALDMNEVDFLDQLGVAVVGMPKDFVPSYLRRYKDDPQVRDVGAIVNPNLEQVYAAKPDLILISSLQANHYPELSQIAPTIHYDVDYRNSHAGHLDIVKAHLLTLGQIFEKPAQAQQIAAQLDASVADVRAVTSQGQANKALIVLHNNGAYSAFGVQSRYGFVFNELGVVPANATAETGLHGRPISSEFIQQVNPDVIYVVDRTAVMEHNATLNKTTMANPLLKETSAWQNDRVVFVDPYAWYVTAASPTSVQHVMRDIAKGFAQP